MSIKENKNTENNADLEHEVVEEKPQKSKHNKTVKKTPK